MTPSSEVRSLCEPDRSLPFFDDPSSAIVRGVELIEALVTRLWLLVLRLLLALEGITGPPTLGDCGNLLEPDLFNPDSGIASLDGLTDGVPSRAANDCDLATSEVSSLLSTVDALRTCACICCVLANWLAPRGGIMDAGLDSFEGGGIVFLSSSMALLPSDSAEPLVSSESFLELLPLS